MRDVQFIAFAALATICLPACAYIDPGTGSAIVSLIIGFFVALGLTFKTYWYKLKALFGRQAQSDSSPGPEPENPAEDSSKPLS